LKQSTKEAIGTIGVFLCGIAFGTSIGVVLVLATNNTPPAQPTRILLTPPDKAWVWTMDGLCEITPRQADDLAKLLHVAIEVREGP